jgi:hypothetical protein
MHFSKRSLERDTSAQIALKNPMLDTVRNSSWAALPDFWVDIITAMLERLSDRLYKRVSLRKYAKGAD